MERNDGQQLLVVMDEERLNGGLSLPMVLDDKDEACQRQAEEEADQRKEELRKWQRARMGRLFVLAFVTFIAGLATTYVLWDSFAPIIALPLGVCISGILAFGAAMVDAGNDPMWQGSLELTLKRAADDRKRGWLLIIGGLVGVLVLVVVRIFVYAGPIVALLLGSIAVLMVDLAPIGAALWHAQVERVCRDLSEKYNHAEEFARQLQKHPEQAGGVSQVVAQRFPQTTTPVSLVHGARTQTAESVASPATGGKDVAQRSAVGGGDLNERGEETCSLPLALFLRRSLA